MIKVAGGFFRPPYTVQSSLFFPLISCTFHVIFVQGLKVFPESQYTELDVVGAFHFPTSSLSGSSAFLKKGSPSPPGDRNVARPFPDPATPCGGCFCEDFTGSLFFLKKYAFPCFVCFGPVTWLSGVGLRWHNEFYRLPNETISLSPLFRSPCPFLPSLDPRLMLR